MSPQTERRPLPPTLSVLQARDTYLAENGFDTSGYAASTFDVEAFGRKYTFPNTPDRKWAIPLHDLHHVATGYGTDLVGEAEVGAFELVGGCRTTVVYVLDIVAVILGMIVAPLRTLRAFSAARRARTLFRASFDYDELLGLSVGALRDRLGLPPEGLSCEPRRLHDEREAMRRDALHGARPLPRWAAALGAVYGASTFGVVAFELWRGRTLEGVALDGGGARWVGHAVAVLALLLAASAVSARRGSLGGRALFGHATFGRAALDVVSLAAFGMSPVLAALSLSVPLLLLFVLARPSKWGRPARPVHRTDGGGSSCARIVDN